MVVISMNLSGSFYRLNSSMIKIGQMLIGQMLIGQLLTDADWAEPSIE